MQRKITFIKIHCVKIILMFVFSWAFNQSRVRALCVNSLLTLFYYHIVHTRTWFYTDVCMHCVCIDWFGLVGLKSHTSFIHQVLSDMNSWRKERLLSLSPCLSFARIHAPSHFVFWLKRRLTLSPVFRPSNEHPTNKQTKKTQEHFFIDVIIR